MFVEPVSNEAIMEEETDVGAANSSQPEVIDDESDLDSESSNESSDEVDNLSEVPDDFTFNEDEPSIIFDEFAEIPKHMQCVAHKLQLVLKDAFKDGEMVNMQKVISF